MENKEIAAQLRATERSEAAGWIHVPQTPWWVPLYFGGYAAAAAWAMGALDGLAGSLVLLALTGSALLMIRWQRTARGTWPTSNPPRELRRPLGLLLAGATALCLVCWAVGEQWGWPPAAVLAGVLATALSWTYERSYARAARAARERLA